MREAAVLAGGRSRRMGTDKALLEVAGRPLIARSLDWLGERFDRLLVSVSRDGPSREVEELLDAWTERGARLEVVRDRRAGRPGPLAAVEAVLGALEGPAVFVVAVDVPGLHPGLVDALCGRLVREGRLGVIPRWRRGLEPLYAAYRRALLSRVASLLDAGLRAPRCLADEPGVSVLDVRGPGEDAPPAGGGASFVSAASPAAIFHNLNAPSDLQDTAWSGQDDRGATNEER